MFLNSPHSRNIIFNARLEEAPGFPNRARGGFALVFALAMLVLLMTIVLAYFSNAMLHRQISVASAANLKVQLITKTAADLILDDFQHEIEAGSLADANSSLTMPVRRPISLTSNGIGVTNMLAPSVVPQRIGDGGVTNIVKVSRSGLSFFTNGTGYRALTNRASDGLARASAISTTNTSANGRFLTKERWLAPKLMSDSETNAFTVPDWIYLNRKGETPTDFTASALATAANSDSTNTGCVIGRYAYTVYDVGGLLDINVIGNALPSTNNAIRGLAHQVSLSNGIGGVSVPNFTNFVTWRSAVSSTNTNAASGSGGLFDPKRNFIDVPASEQAFVNRQDLLNYVAQSGTAIPSAALPFLTTFSRDLNAPSYEPNSSRSKLPDTNSADVMNPAILTNRFTTDATLSRPDSGSISVNSGTPVMVRRFPLSKLNLFAQANPDPSAMSYYFGLTKIDAQTWKYTATNSSKGICTLSEVAALKREPNFFEVLQAVINTGSLGQNNGIDTYSSALQQDLSPTLQVMQIGVNIIDQWDADNIPTCVQFTGKVAVTPFEKTFSVYGIENLPYLNQVALVGFRPTFDRSLFQVWALFDVWNPHQNAAIPTDIDQFRVQPTSGQGRMILSYYNVIYPTLNAAPAQTFYSSIKGSAFNFSNNLAYTEPTTLAGTEPKSSSDSPGLLIMEEHPVAAVPLTGRSTTLQSIITTLETSLGTNVGVKAPNTCRLKGGGQFPNTDIWGFDLQAHKRASGTNAAQWVTYQRFENFGLNQFDTMNCPSTSALPEPLISDNTEYGYPNAPLINEFYVWRSRGTTVGMIKVDPRTSRFGLSGWSAFLGNSIRNSTNSLPNAILNGPDSIINSTNDWCFPGGYSVGKTAVKTLATNFDVITQFKSSLPQTKNRMQIGLYGLVANNPDLFNSDNPVRYSDPDGIIRPGDGYFGGFPTAIGQLSARPILLNRPFRSVGELGYVFRDIPWKTLDFFSRRSGDLGLLDVFSISETDGDLPLTAGKVNLNTRQAPVLAAALQNSFKQTSSQLTAVQANTIAAAIVAESTARPFAQKGDLVDRVLNAGGTDPLAGDSLKVAREAAVRTLAEIGTTRTWNFMIDLVAQTGRFTAASKSGSDFMVQSEERVWIHVAIDRMTGEVLELRKEVVNE